MTGRRPLAKAGLVALGYVAAFALAWVVLSVYIAATSGPDRQTYGVMYDFGDSLLFLAVFGVAAMPATGTALFFLRPSRGFWLTLSIAFLTVAATSLATLATYVSQTPVEPHSLMYLWSALSPIRMLTAPLFAIFFVLFALIAPNRSARIALIAASAVEMSVFTYVALTWFQYLR